jgi:hypothetical protein
MASSRILFPQFRDEQSSSRYPFVDGATLASNTTGLIISADLFVDASFFGIGGAGKLYLSAVTVSSQNVTITIGDTGASGKFFSTFNALSPPADGRLNFQDAYGRPAGVMITDPSRGGTEALTVFSSWALGTHRFNQDATEFVSTVVIPAAEPGVRALLTADETLHTGDVWLIGKGGVVIRAEGDDVIRVDIVGEPLFKRFVCAPQTEFPTRTFLRTINGCGPDEFGNFIFTATDKLVDNPAIRIFPNNDTLTFTNVGGAT